jgi:hypothetical protein
LKNVSRKFFAMKIFLRKFSKPFSKNFSAIQFPARQK